MGWTWRRKPTPCCRTSLPACLRLLPPCRRIANRLRSALGEEERAGLERALAALAPIFDLGAPHPGDDGGEGGGADVAAVAAGHAVIEELAAAGCERADALARAARDAAARLVAAAAAGATEAAPAGGEGEAAGVAPAAAAPSSGPSAEPEAQPEGEGEAKGEAEREAAAQAAPAALGALAGLHATGVKSVAELCSLCLERLLALGRSLSSHYRYGRPANDGIAWPPGAEAAALLLRRQALRMLDDLAGVGAAFGAALASAGGCRRTGRVCGACGGARHGGFLAAAPASCRCRPAADVCAACALSPMSRQPPGRRGGRPGRRQGVQPRGGAAGAAPAGRQRGGGGAGAGGVPRAAAGGVADQRAARGGGRPAVRPALAPPKQEPRCSARAPCMPLTTFCCLCNAALLRLLLLLHFVGPFPWPVLLRMYTSPNPK